MANEVKKPSRKVELASRTILELRPRELRELAALLVQSDCRQAQYLAQDLDGAIESEPLGEGDKA